MCIADVYASIIKQKTRRQKSTFCMSALILSSCMCARGKQLAGKIKTVSRAPSSSPLATQYPAKVSFVRLIYADNFFLARIDASVSCSTFVSVRPSRLAARFFHPAERKDEARRFIHFFFSPRSIYVHYFSISRSNNL